LAQAQIPAVAPAEAAPVSTGAVATVTHLSGTLTVKRADGSTRFLSVKSGITEGDTLVTARGTYARMKFSDGAETVLRPESQMKVDAYRYDEKKPEADNTIISLLKGGMRSVTGLLGRRNRDKVVVNAPGATIGIRGTHFGMLVCSNDCGSIPTPAGGPPPNGLHVDVLDGAVTVRNNAGSQTLNAGQFGYVRNATTPPVQVPPAQGIQVTMPVAISRNAAAGGTVGKGQQAECVVP
jgi:ferric-dicitrate binding protein FerR (iron transport regulator)